MKKRVFRYKAIAVLLFIIEFSISILFGYGVYASFEDLRNTESISLDNMIFPFALSIFITAILCIVSLITRGKKTVFFFNIHYIIIVLLFAFGFMKQLSEGAELDEDLLKFITAFSVLGILLLTINFFKAENIDFLEIDEIGN